MDLQWLINSVDDVLWLYSLEQQCFLYISPSVYNIRGFTPQEAMQEALHESLEEEDYMYVANHLGPRIQRFEQGEAEFGSMKTEVRQIHKNGSHVWVEMSTTLIKNTEGKVVQIAGVSRDISNRKKQEQVLQDTKSFLETTFNFTSTGIALLHENGKIINTNKGFGRMLGYPPEFLMGKSLYDFIVQGDESCIRELFQLAIKEREMERQSEIRLVNIHGEIVWGLITLSGVLSVQDNAMRWVIQIQETTERKKSDEIIRLLNADLQLKNKEMEQLVYVTSHDLRSPLVNIRGFNQELSYSFEEAKKLFQQQSSQEMMEELARIEKDIQESFQYINISINKMDKLLGGLLQYSRLGKKMSSPGVVNMNELMADVVKNFEYIIKTKDLKIEIGTLHHCWAREEMINQAFANLLGNALKYLDPKRKGHISMSSDLTHDYVVYTLEDNGIGIEPEYHQKIFDLFCRLNPQICEGEGLGLSTVKKILELNHGKICLESEPGKGSRFLVWLPQEKEKAEKTD